MDTTPDAKDQVEASSASAIAVEPQKDVTAAPSAATDATKTVNEESVVQSVVDGLAESSTAVVQKEVEGVQEEPTPKVEEKKGEEPPFHTHPRWQEKVKEVTELKAEVEKLKSFEQQVAQLTSYCEQNNINDQQLKDALELTALLNTAPEKALERLKPVYDILQQYVNGDGLPEDLQAEVSNNQISLERAKEINKYRAQQRVSASRTKLTAEQQQKVLVQQIQRDVTSWDMSKRATNPDFKPKASPTEPDGVWEFVQARFNSSLQMLPATTPQEVIRCAEQAYDAVVKGLARFVPQPPVSRTLPVNGSTTKSTAKARSVDDVVNIIASGGKYQG